MKKIVKIVTLILIAIFISMLFCGCSSDYQSDSKIVYPTILKDIYVYDQGDFLDDNVEQQVNSWLVELEHQSEIEFAVITIPSLDGMSIEDYAYELANNLGIGKAETDNGILLLISRTDSKVRLEIGKGLQGILTDGKSGEILDKYFVPHREVDNYNEAVTETAEAVINYLSASEEYEIKIKSVDSSIAVEYLEPPTMWQVVLTIVAIILLLILIEYATGNIYGDGFGDGIVFWIIDSGGSSGGSFGGGGFSGGGASR